MPRWPFSVAFEVLIIKNLDRYLALFFIKVIAAYLLSWLLECLNFMIYHFLWPTAEKTEVQMNITNLRKLRLEL